MSLENRFTYHSPKGDQAERYGLIRANAKAFFGRIARLPAMSNQTVMSTVARIGKQTVSE